MTASTQTLRMRGALIWTLRQFFHDEGFIEVEAPSIVCSPGLEPHLDAIEIRRSQSGDKSRDRRWLHTSPEYALKRVLCSGLDRVYHLGSSFRDEPSSSTHSPEFTMLEWYMRDASLDDLMSQCERLLCTLASRMLEDPPSIIATDQTSQNDVLRRLNALQAPFERLSVHEAFLRYAHIDLLEHPTAERLAEAAREVGVAERGLHGGWDALYFQIFMDKIEPHLGRDRPTFLYNFPASQAALAKLDPHDSRWALRFEIFIDGIELANAFDELSDPLEQRARFIVDQAERRQLNKEVYPIDEPLLSTLAHLGQCVGIALGVDRLMMLMLGAQSIDEVRTQSWHGP
jgi:elongation factor P--(R)-beta-lysine ligase